MCVQSAQLCVLIRSWEKPDIDIFKIQLDDPAPLGLTKTCSTKQTKIHLFTVSCSNTLIENTSYTKYSNRAVYSTVWIIE